VFGLLLKYLATVTLRDVISEDDAVYNVQC